MSELPTRSDATGVPARNAERAAAAAPGSALLRLMRPRQWTKNLLLFAALIFAVELLDVRSVLLAILAFASFCLASSSVYVVNDLVDAERDRQHPHKRTRPIASGAVSPRQAVALAALLTVAAFALAFAIGVPFAATVAIYVGMTHFYSFVGKNVVVLDTMLVATGFVVRAVAGAVAIDVPYSSWFVLCTFFLALFLSVSKRKAEILALDEATRAVRPVLRHYTLGTLGGMQVMTVAAVLMSYALYVMEFAEAAGSHYHMLELTFPFVMYGVFRYYLLVETADLGETPEEVLLGDRPIQICVLGFTAVALLALYAGAG